MEQVKEVARKHGGKMSHSALWAIMAIFGGSTYTPLDLAPASKGYVDAKIQAVQTGVGENTEKLDQIVELQLVDRLEKLLRFKCMHPNDPTVDDTIRELESQYRRLTGSPYQRPSCAYLTGQ